MHKPSNHKAAIYVVALVILSLFTQVLPRPVTVVAAKDVKTEIPATTIETTKEGLPEPQPAPTVLPNSPAAATITATLTDNITQATKIAPGANINYTATITNNGAASPADNATNLNYSGPLDANTTLVAGSVHASPIAFNDTYNWVGNTQLDTAARALPVVTANDVAVNPPAGTDTFTLTGIAGGATTLGGTVTLTAGTGAFVYTPPLGRPNVGDGASVNDSFTYTITNSADPSLTATGTVTITLTGRVWYLQAGAAGDGRSNTPSGSPSAMSTAADKTTDIFYIFSNAGSLDGLFSLDNSQQLLGQGVNLVVNIPTLGSVTLFNAAAPTPTTTDSAAASNCVTLGNGNTLSGFNIGNCTGLAISGANVGTLTINTLSINTTGGGINLTGVATPTVSVVLGGLTATGGTTGASLTGMNGTITLAGGTLSGASGSEFAVNGGAAAISFTGNITQNNAQRVADIQNTTGGSVTLSGTVTGGASSLGVNLNTDNGSVTFTTLNLGTAGSRMTNQAVTIANGTGTYGLGTANIFTNNATGLSSSNADGTLNITGGTVDATNGRALIIDGPAGLTTLGISLTKVASTNSTTTGMTLQDVNGSFTVTGDNANTAQGGNGTGGTISGVTGADGSTGDDGASNGVGIGVYLFNTTGVQLRRMIVTTTSNFGLEVENTNGLTVQYCKFNGTQGDNTGQGEGSARFLSMTGTVTIDNCEMTGSKANDIRLDNTSVSMTDFIVSNNNLHDNDNLVGNDGVAIDLEGTSVIKTHITGNQLSNHLGDHIDVTTTDTASADVIIKTNTCTGTRAAAPASPGDLGRGIRIFSSAYNSPALIRYDISSNTINNSVQGGSIHVTAGGPGTGTYTGQITNNIIGTTGVNGSGSLQADGIIVEQNGSGAHNVAITGNTIRQVFQVGINANVTTPGTNGTLDATITNNTVAEHATTASTQPGVLLNSGNTSGPPPSANAVCYDLKNNSIAGAGTNSGIGSEDFRVRQRFSTTVRLPGATAGDLASTAAIVTFLQNQNTGVETGSATTQAPGSFVGGAACTAPSVPTIPQPDDTASNRMDGDLDSYLFTNAKASAKQTLAKASVSAAPVAQVSPKVGNSSVLAKATIPKATAAEVARIYRSERPLSNHAVGRNLRFSSGDQNAPTSGETVTLSTITTFPAGGKSITIKYSATVNAPPLARQVSTQASVSGGNFVTVTSTDPGPPIVGGPTVTLVDTLMTWNGATNTDWNTATNWTQPAGGTQYAPGVSNPAVNDVVMPGGAMPNEPTIGTSDIAIFSYSISNGRTLTITSPRILTIGGAPGGDLTLSGAIVGGELRFGTGSHQITNSFATGSIDATNTMTILSGSTVNLINDIPAGSLVVNAGGSFTLSSMSLKGSLNNAGTLTLTGSTLTFNGSGGSPVAQTITNSSSAFNNLVINNTSPGGSVTLGSSITVNGLLTLTSSDLSTGANTLTMPPGATSGPATNATDVVGNVKRTGFVSGGAALSFGNPFNTIKINSGAAPADITVNLVKSAPVGFSQAVQRTYTITPNGASGPATLRLHYLDTELNGNTPEANLNLRRFNGTVWKPVVATASNTADATNNWLENNAVATFSPWTFSTFTPTASNSLISGRITDNDGNPLGGVVVGLSNGRRTITRADGNYLFSEVPTGDFYTLTPILANHQFTPHTRSFSLVGNVTDAAFAGNADASQTANPLDTDMYFVRQQYLDFLGREPDEGGLQFWTSQISTCLDDQDCIRARRIDVSAAFFITQEFQQSGAYIYDLYQGTLNRRPAFTEYSTDRPQVIGGADLDTQKDAFARSFVQRPEFLAKYQSNTSAETFVDALIQSVQFSGVDLSAERDGLIAAYNSGIDQTTSRALVVRAIADDTTFRQSQYNQAFVLMEYFDYLQRDIDQGGYNFWLDVLNTGKANNYRGMVCSFLTATEYQHRFATVVTHNNGECSGP